MKKVNAIGLLVILLSGCWDVMDISESQSSTFLKFYNTYPVCTGADVKEVNGVGYAILGTVESFTSGSQICLARTDYFGNLLDSVRHYGNVLDDKAYCLKVLPDGGFGILGSIKNPDTDKLEVYFLRTNRVGDILWSRSIQAIGVNVEAYHFETDASGSFYMTGYAERSSTQTDKQIWIYALNSEGEDLWPAARTFGGEKDEEAHHLQILSDGKLIITGHTKSYPSGTLINHIFLLKTNSSGLTVAFFAVNSVDDEEGACVRALEDGSFLITGTSRSAASSKGSEILVKKVMLLPSEVQTEWSHTFGGSGNDFGKCLMVRGSSIHILGTLASSGTNTSITLITTSADGSNPVSANFGQESQFSASSFERTSDNGFIIIGTNKNLENSASVALIKTNADGSL